VPSGELNKDLNDPARVGEVSRLMSQHLPKFANWMATFPRVGGGKEGATDPTKPGTSLLFLNQERATISTGGGGYGAPEANTTGGKALKFYTSVRLRLNKLKTETLDQIDPMTKKTIKRPYGTLTQVKVVKDKLDGRQGHTGNIFIRYGYGIDNYHSVIESAVAHNIMKKEGSYYAFGSERCQGRDRFRQYLIDNPKQYNELEKALQQAILVSSKPVADAEIDSASTIVDDEFDSDSVEGIGIEVDADVAESGEE